MSSEKVFFASINVEHWVTGACAMGIEEYDVSLEGLIKGV